jgi:hypothetical protein
MKENFRQQPENPKQHAPEAGAGPLGLLPPDPEQQGGGVNKPELPPPEEESEELAKNEEFLKKLTRLTSLPPLSEDFYKRLGERLKQIPQDPKQEK